MRHAIIWITGLLLMMVGLAGCNPVEDEAKDNTDTGTSDVTTPDTSGAIKLGFNLEMTGNVASYGNSTKEGAQLAIEDINGAGGVLGRQLEAIWHDNASKSDQAVTVAQTLVDQEDVDVLIGAVASTNSIAMAKVAEESKVPMVTPASTNPQVTVNEDGTVRRYIFRTCFIDDFQAERIADFAASALKAERAVILYDAESDYSVGIRDVINRVAPGLGLEIVEENSFLATGEMNFRPVLSQFKDQDFDVLFVPAYYNQVAQIAIQAREIGLTQPLIGGDGFDSPDLWGNAGASIEGSFFSNHYAASDPSPMVQDFISKYKTAYGGKTPDAMAILGYDAVLVVADAITRAGGTDPEAVVDALAATTSFNAATGEISMNEYHNAEKNIVIIEVAEGGEFAQVMSYGPNDAIGQEVTESESGFVFATEAVE